MALDDELDALYRGSLGEFVDRRKALAASLKKAGDKESAARVAALPKPTPAAWVVNVLWSERGEDLEALLGLGERLRDALRASFAGQGDGRDAAALQHEQRAAIDRLARAARERLVRAGAPSSPAILERVASTLRAIATTGTWGDAAPGRLARELDPPDLATLATLLLADGGGRSATAARLRASAAPPRAATGESASRPVAKLSEARVARAEAALEKATERERASREAADRAAAVADRTRAERDAAAGELAAARRAADEAEDAAVAARKAADAAQAAVGGTETRLAAAERRHAEADERARRAAADAAGAQEAREAARAALTEARGRP